MKDSKKRTQIRGHLSRLPFDVRPHNDKLNLSYVWPSVLSLSNVNLQRIKEVRNIFIQEKLIGRLTFDPGLALDGFRTTRP